MKKIGTIVDVRTREEFVGGHIQNSINIPLQEITNHIEEIKTMEGPIIFCCASGVRSGHAADYFSALGITCENGGGWLSLNSKL